MIAVLGAATALLGAAPVVASQARLQAKDYAFVLKLPGGKALTSAGLVGAELEMTDPSGQLVTARVESVAPAKERPDVLLHRLSVRDPTSGSWGPMCDADIHGRRAAFPVSGRWAGQRYVRDAKSWFLTCSAGSQGKCILWGYDPWRRGPRGEDLAVYYQACQHMVHADYAGDGVAHTRNGTDIDIADIAGIQTWETEADPAFAFEAGWGPDGAVCVARTRWPDLLSMQALRQAHPRLAQGCDEAEARRRGALLLVRSRLIAEAHAPAAETP